MLRWRAANSSARGDDNTLTLLQTALETAGERWAAFLAAAPGAAFPTLLDGADVALVDFNAAKAARTQLQNLCRLQPSVAALISSARSAATNATDDDAAADDSAAGEARPRKRSRGKGKGAPPAAPAPAPAPAPPPANAPRTAGRKLHETVYDAATKTLTVTFNAFNDKRANDVAAFDCAGIAREVGVDVDAVCWPFHVLYAGTTDPNKDKGALAQLVCPTPNDTLHRNISAPAHRPIPALTRDVIQRFRS